MDTNAALLHASTLLARANSSSGSRPSFYKAVGISLAVASGFFIGISFVLKKIGLLKANVRYNEEAGEGYGYLKNVWWWTGMTLMIIGEICNFVAYAFVDAILVTPLGALSVVITTILSAIFLKERLSFVGKVGCFSCIIGSIVIAMNAPQQSSVSDIQEMQNYVVAPGFLTWAGLIIVGSLITALWVGPRYGKKSMFVYLSICSMIGGLSVVATQGLGSAIIAQINGESQFTHWFLYVLFVFVVATLLTEIIYLNKALNIFNAALVTPTYYVMFTSATIVTSAILFQGFKGSGIEIATVIMGFLQICAGVVLLQLSKSAKDVPDAAVFKGDLDQIREVATQEDPEYEPKADSIRGAASIIRRISTTRRDHEVDEARRYVLEKQEDFLRPPGQNEIVEWDGIRRRKTIVGAGPTMSRPHTPRTASFKQELPPLGMSRFPDPEAEEDQAEEDRPAIKQSGTSFLTNMRSRASSARHPTRWHSLSFRDGKNLSPNDASVSMTEITRSDTKYHGAEGLEPPVFPTGRGRSDTPRSIHWADEKGGDQGNESPRPAARRQFSFNTMFGRFKSSSVSPKRSVSPPRGILRRTHLAPGGDLHKSGTEEERLGLVKGDSRMTEETLGEKLDRWSSDNSDMSEGKPMGSAQHNRPHGDSMSSMSTSAFPAYEDHHAFYTQGNVSNPYYLPPSRQATASPEHMDEHEGLQFPTPSGSRPRTRTGSSSHPRAPPPSQSSFTTHRYPNPLPPLPDERIFVEGPSGVRSASSGSSDLGVSSLPSSPENRDDDSHVEPRRNHPVRPESDWRRNVSDGSNGDGEARDERERGSGRGGAFV